MGSTSRAELADAADIAGRRLHREVNITRISPVVWDAGDDPFVKTLTARPLVRLDVVRGDDALASDKPSVRRPVRKEKQ